MAAKIITTFISMLGVREPYLFFPVRARNSILFYAKKKKKVFAAAQANYRTVAAI